MTDLTPKQAFDLASELQTLRSWKREVTAEEAKVTAALRGYLVAQAGEALTLDNGTVVKLQRSLPSRVYAPERLTDAELVELARIPGLFKVDGATLTRMAKNSDNLAIHHLRETGAPGAGGSIKIVFEGNKS